MFSIGIISPIPNNSNIAAITVRIKIKDKFFISLLRSGYRIFLIKFFKAFSLSLIVNKIITKNYVFFIRQVN